MPDKPEHKIVITGAQQSRVDLLIGLLLYKCSAIDLKTVGYMEKHGKAQYAEVVPVFRDLQKTLAFETQGSHFKIVAANEEHSCVVVPIAKDEELVMNAGNVPVIYVVDTDWNVATVEELGRKILGRLTSDGPALQTAWIVPVGMSKGENILNPAPDTTCLLMDAKTKDVQRISCSFVGCLDRLFSHQASQS